LVPPESAATVPDGDNQCRVQSSFASLIGVRGSPLKVVLLLFPTSNEFGS
jgi:hypothetical protein